jgi:hypothetical protein
MRRVARAGVSNPTPAVAPARLGATQLIRAHGWQRAALMREQRAFRVPSSWSLRSRSLGIAGAVAVLLVMVVAAMAGSATPARPDSIPGSSAGSTSASAAVPTASPACYNINQTICVAMENASEPNVIPNAGSHVSGVEPPATTTLSFHVESTYDLVWPTAHYFGALSPIAINITGTLWNGVPYYNASDGSVWHPPGTTWWTYGPVGENATYPFWYDVNVTARTASGPQFFPGMHVDWWLYITSNSSGVLHHFSSVTFQYTYAGAFPASPYPTAYQYAGSSAALEDVAIAQSPAAPNFNSSVNVNVTTTSLDLTSGASLGGGYLDFTELAPDGALIEQTSWSFPVQASGTTGAYATNLTIPAALSQVPGALVEYTVTMWDTNLYGPDQVVSPTYNYTVNGNGTFAAGDFGDNLVLSVTPGSAMLGGSPPPQIRAGESVRVLVTSRVPSTSILTAELRYSFDYPGIGENVTQQLAMQRLNATNFVGTIPAMPLNSTVTYSVTAWDFLQDETTSPEYTYTTPSLANAVATVPTNSTFFLTYVYDEGQHAWVTGATVTVASTPGFVRTMGTTFLGVDYPNATGTPFVPVFLPAGSMYRVYVNDSNFRPGGASAPSVLLDLRAPHTFTTNGVIAVGDDYEVAESGNAFYFFLNDSGPGVTYSPGSGNIDTGTILGAGIGLGALALVGVPTLLWWRSIRARRISEERRVTL